jgi:hypothetical protein
MTWDAALLVDAPTAGSVRERHFDAGVPGGSWLWVLFRRDAKPVWAGSFRRELARPDSVHFVPEANAALVIAGARSYWVSLEAEAARSLAPLLFLAASIPSRPLVIGADFTSLFLLSEDGVVWRSRRLALDGISFTDVAADDVRGVATTPSGPVPFQVDIVGRQVTGGLQSER